MAADKQQEAKMFGKEQDQAAPAADARATSILAQGCKFNGDVEVAGTFRVEGEFEGTIRNPETLVVGKTGVVKASVTVKNAIIGGRIYGNIHAENKIELQGGSHVEGDIKTRRLVIDEGVFFEGNCSMGNVQGTSARPEPTKQATPPSKEQLAQG